MSKFMKIIDDHDESLQGNDEADPQLIATVSLDIPIIPNNEENANEYVGHENMQDHDSASSLNNSGNSGTSNSSSDDGKPMFEILQSASDQIINSVNELLEIISKDTNVTKFGEIFNVKKDKEDVLILELDDRIESAGLNTLLKVKNPTNQKIYFNIEYISIQKITSRSDILQIGEVKEILIVIKKVPCSLKFRVQIYAPDSENDDDFKDDMWLTLHADKITKEQFVWNVDAPKISCLVADEALKQYKLKILTGVRKISKQCLKLKEENVELKNQLLNCEEELKQITESFIPVKINKSKKAPTGHYYDDDGNDV